RRRRRIQGAAGGVAALVIIAVIIPATIGVLGRTPGGAPGHWPAGLAGGQAFFAGVTPANVVNIYRSTPGWVVASLRPPGPYPHVGGVGGLGGTRRFVAAVIGFSPSTCTSHLFWFSIDG